MIPWVLDHTALVALFAGHPELFDLLEAADQGQEKLILPAVAVAEASQLVSATDGSWRVILQMRPNVVVTELDESTAIGTARHAGTLPVRHVTYEAEAARGVIVTRAPWQYPAGGPPLRMV